MTACHDTNLRSLSKLAGVALLAILTCIALTACKPAEVAKKEPASPDTYFPIGFGGKTLYLQLAITPAEQQKGLMFRKELATDHGMLFLSQQPRPQGFWMKNTSLPLDIGYLDAGGSLVEVHKLFPFDETPVASRSQKILIAVETNRGWYTKNDIKPGAQLEMEALKAALAERGFTAEAYPFIE